jgi:hypothetical protein
VDSEESAGGELAAHLEAQLDIRPALVTS